MSLFLSRAGAVVQAGAGSGKTHSLVGLCLHLLGGVGRAEPLPPARLCAVTFTEKAAAELLSRLRGRLDRLALEPDRAALRALEPELFASCEALGREPPAREIWLRARRDLNDAEIGTLHSVAMRILRRHAAAAGLDPSFAVLDPLDGAMLFAESCERTVLGALEAPPASGARGAATEAGAREAAAGDARRAAAERLCEGTVLRRSGPYGSGVADDLQRLAMALGESGRTPRELVDATPGLDEGRAREGWSAAIDGLGRALDSLEQAARFAGKGASPDRARSGLAAIRARIPSLRALAPGALRSIWPPLDEAAKNLPSKGKSDLGQAVGSVKESLVALLEADAAVRACALARDLALLAGEAIARHREEKSRRRALEFDDLTRLACALLRRDPAVRRAEKARIEALLIDEFQDTSRAQLELCGWLAEERGVEGGEPEAGGSEHDSGGTEPAGSGLPGARAIAKGLLWLVGDRKQSIYEFRGADVGAAQAFAARANRDGAERHFLRTSYRSLPPLVAFANGLFAKLLPSQPDPDAPFQCPFIPGEDDLRAHRSMEPATQVIEPSAELLQAHGDLDDEAAAVARRIAQLLAPGSPARVREKDASGAERPRPVRGGDIAILMRSFLPVEALRRALLRARIPHVIVGGRLFHEAREVLDLRALLRLLLDRDDANALAAVLRSPLGPLSDDALTLLARGPRALPEGAGATPGPADSPPAGARRAGRGLARRALDDHALLAQLAPDDAAAARRLHALLARLESQVDALGPSELLEAALAETHYRAAIAGGLFGEQAVANVERLLEMARALEQETARPAGALRALLARLDALEAQGGGEAEATVVEEKSEHAVRLLTIHAAKGLEFPVVFVPLTGMLPPNPPGLLVDPELGLALRLKGADGDPCWGTAGRAVLERHKARDDAQSRRLLYVAATRARDRVIFTGRTATRRESVPSWWSLLNEAASAPELAGLVARVDAGDLPRPARTSEPPLIDSLADLDALAAAANSSPPAALLPGPLANRAAAAPARATLIAPVTQLANAALCPRRYQLLHELGLDEHPRREPPADGSPPVQSPRPKLPQEQVSDDLLHEQVSHDFPEPISDDLPEQLPHAFADPDDPPLDASERGTLAHQLLEELPLDAALPESELRRQAEQLLAAARVPEPERAPLIDAALAFLCGETGARVRAMPERQRRRELPFALHLEPPAGAPGPKLLVRGQIDLLVLEDARALVLDYKLSRRRDPEAYALQLGAYALAAHRLIEGRLPVQTGLVFLRSRGAPVVLRPASGQSELDASQATLLAAARAIHGGRERGAFPKSQPGHCRAIECGFLRRCHPEEAQK